MAIELRRGLVWLACVALVLNGAGVIAAADDPLGEREASLRLMSAVQRDQLRKRHERFLSLPPQEQAKLRQLEHSLATGPDGAELREVMQRYHNWLGGLPSSQRIEILGLPPEQRIGRIKTLLAAQNAVLRVQAVSFQDLEAILGWVRDRVKDLEPKLLDELSEHDRQEILQISSLPSRSLRLILAVTRVRKLQDDPARHEKILEIEREDREEIVGRLSSRAQETYRQTPTEEEQRKLVQQWIVRAMFRSFSTRGRRPGSDLRRFIEIEAPTIRDQLDYLPPDRIRVELEKFDSGRREEEGSRRPDERKTSKP